MVQISFVGLKKVLWTTFGIWGGNGSQWFVPTGRVGRTSAGKSARANSLADELKIRFSRSRRIRRYRSHLCILSRVLHLCFGHKWKKTSFYKLTFWAQVEKDKFVKVKLTNHHIRRSVGPWYCRESVWSWFSFALLANSDSLRLPLSVSV